jgi:hypothetical protein
MSTHIPIHRATRLYVSIISGCNLSPTPASTKRATITGIDLIMDPGHFAELDVKID